jgi:putative oxidoreductase
MFLFKTPPDVGLLILRLALAIFFFPHGAQKMLGWFGGQGPAATVGYFGHMGIPALFAWLAILAEFLGAIGLFVGLLGRIAALGILSNMAVAIALVHSKNGFFMNWQGNKTGEGFEYHILAIAIALVIIIRGSGLWSLDRVVSAKLGTDGDVGKRR